MNSTIVDLELTSCHNQVSRVATIKSAMGPLASDLNPCYNYPLHSSHHPSRLLHVLHNQNLGDISNVIAVSAMWKMPRVRKYPSMCRLQATLTVTRTRDFTLQRDPATRKLMTKVWCRWSRKEKYYIRKRGPARANSTTHHYSYVYSTGYDFELPHTKMISKWRNCEKGLAPLKVVQRHLWAHSRWWLDFRQFAQVCGISKWISKITLQLPLLCLSPEIVHNKKTCQALAMVHPVVALLYSY